MTDEIDDGISPHVARDDLAKLGVTLTNSNFGAYLTNDQQHADNMVLLCYNVGFGENTVQIALPHQIYVEKLKELIKSNPGITTVSITPLDTSRRVMIPRKLVEAL